MGRRAWFPVCAGWNCIRVPLIICLREWEFLGPKFPVRAQGFRTPQMAEVNRLLHSVWKDLGSEVACTCSKSLGDGGVKHGGGGLAGIYSGPGPQLLPLSPPAMV